MNHTHLALLLVVTVKMRCCAVRAALRIQMDLLSGDDKSCLLQLAQLVAAALGRLSLAASLQPPRYCAC